MEINGVKHNNWNKNTLNISRSKDKWVGKWNDRNNCLKTKVKEWK